MIKCLLTTRPYVGYIFLELPAALTMRYAHPRFVFGVPVLVFGVIAAVFSAADSYAALMVLRVLLGLCEVFVNNSWQYLAMWYKPSELAFRTGVYLRSASAMSLS